MTKTYDVAVIGLGAMGSATLWQLARRGLSVVGIDRYAPPHTFGSSHGETRLTRQAIGEGEAYLPLVLRSHEIWKEIGELTGKQLLVECGFLLVASGGAAPIIHGKPGFAEETKASARKYGIPHEVLDSAGISSRFPQFIGLSGDESAYFEPGGGYVRPELCIESQLALARASGAELRLGDPVTAITPLKAGVHIKTQSAMVAAAGHAIVCAGRWTPLMVPTPIGRQLKVYRQAQHWYPLLEPELYGDGASPAFIYLHGSAPSDQFYGFPPVAGSAFMKVAEETYDAPHADPELRSEIAAGEGAGVYERHIRGRLGGLGSTDVRSAVCYYTSTPDGDFIIDRHPDTEHITVISACSGHGFKHSAAIGESVAQSLAEGASKIPLDAFALRRFEKTGR